MFVGSARFQAIIVVMSSGYMRHLMDKTCIYKITNPKSEEEKRNRSTPINETCVQETFKCFLFCKFPAAMFFVNDHFFTAHFCSVFLFVVSPRLEVPNLGMIIFHSVLTVFC